MDLWETRKRALEATSQALQAEAAVIESILDVLAESAAEFQALESPSPLSRIAAICVIKARNLGLASYSLSLDALAQEAGAIMRPLIETMELLAYIRASPEHLEQAIEGRLPSAGARAKAIDGKFQKWRDYLNTHSAHFALTLESVQHILDVPNERLRITQPFSAAVLRVNFKTLFAVLFLCGVEAVRALDEVAPAAAERLAGRLERLRADGTTLFKEAEAPAPIPQQSNDR